MQYTTPRNYLNRNTYVTKSRQNLTALKLNKLEHTHTHFCTDQNILRAYTEHIRRPSANKSHIPSALSARANSSAVFRGSVI